MRPDCACAAADIVIETMIALRTMDRVFMCDEDVCRLRVPVCPATSGTSHAAEPLTTAGSARPGLACLAPTERDVVDLFIMLLFYAMPIAYVAARPVRLP